MPADHRYIDTVIRYADPDKPAGKLFARALDQSTMSFVPHPTRVYNARLAGIEHGLDSSGFDLVHHQTRVTDFEAEDQIEQIYKPEAVALIKHLTGARRVELFQPQGRWEDGEARGLRQTAASAHVDYTTDSFRLWVRRILGDQDAEREMAGRWAIINLWRGIIPVERRPLAFVDARSMRRARFVEVPIYLLPDQPQPFAGRNLIHDADQQWYYFPLMQPDEVLVFRQYDSEAAAPQPVAHSAIDDPTAAPDARPRASFEIRAALFY